MTTLGDNGFTVSLVLVNPGELLKKIREHSARLRINGLTAIVERKSSSSMILIS
jgi:hypothetical protein